MKNDMTKFKLAQKRNYFKFVLHGMWKPIDLNSLSERERELWEKINLLRSELINEFNSESIKLGLKVLPKCWCGKIGKYVPEYLDEEFYKCHDNSGLVCKKHIKR